MNITEFFQLSSGKWFSQRTNHHLAFNQQEGGKSDIQIEMLESTHPDVIKLCEQYEIDPTTATCGLRVNWSGTMEWDKKASSGSTVLVAIADPDEPSQGQLLRQPDSPETTPIIGRFVIGRDDSLTLITEHGTNYLEEWLWFASPNVRIRTSVLKQADGFSTASFCSEIRMGITPAAPSAATTAQA